MDADLVIVTAVSRGYSPELILEAFRRADAFGSEYDRRRAVPPLEQFDALPPGVMDIRIFDQEVWWVDILRVGYRVAFPQSFTDEHLAAVLQFLTFGATTLQNAYCTAFPARTVPADPTEWLEQTILMLALREEAQRRAL